MATMRDVASLAGVSAKTVSRVFNDDPHVLPETRARVDAALRQLNYVPNAVATTFRTGRAPVIGVVVPDIMDPFFGALARAVESVAAANGQSVVISGFGGDPQREPQAVQSLLRHSPSGLIIAPTSTDQRYLAAWAERTHIVFVDRQPVGVLADSFAEDDISGAHLATSHLVNHGHTRVAFLGDDLMIPTTRDRLTGYREALRQASLDLDDQLVALGALDRASGADALDRLEAAEPTALFCSNARTAMNLAPLLRDCGLAVTSFGDFPLADLLTPSLTTIDQDPQQLGTLAAQRIVDRLTFPDRRYRRRTVLPLELIERDSCAVTTRLDRRGGLQRPLRAVAD